MLKDLLKILSSTPEKIRREIRDLSPKQMKTPPAPEKWSVQLILAHLLDVEENCMLPRARAMVEEERPAFAPFDQEARVGPMRYDRQDPRRTLARFMHHRQTNLKWLRKLRPVDLKRTGRHDEVGEISVENLLSEWAFHDLGHLRQILEVKRYGLFPRLGNLKAYYRLS